MKENERNATKSNILSRINEIPNAGKEMGFKGNPACSVCKRKIVGPGRLIAPGFPTCNSNECGVIKATDLFEVLTTQFGRAMELFTLRTFCRCVEGTTIHIIRAEIEERKDELAEAMTDLIEWQLAFHAWTRIYRAEAIENGRAGIIPPKRIDEVVRIRLKGSWEKIDPTKRLEEEVSSAIRKIRENGPDGGEIPF